MRVENKREKIKTWILRIILIFGSLLVIIPLVWTVLSSLKSPREFTTAPWAFPETLRFENYTNAFTKANMGDYFLNSIIVTILALAFLMILAVPSAYALSRYKFKGSNFLKNSYMAGLFIQSVYIIVPLFLIMNDLNMLNNRLALSLVYAVLQLPFSIYILIGFMQSIPKDYEEAAMIDGCGYARTLTSVIVPLAKPGIITVLIFNFMGFWNEYAMAMTFITTNSKKTLPVGLQNLMEVNKFATDWGAMFAGMVIVMIPTIIVYTLFHKKLTEGVNIGGIKG
ncbi:carbohydrate ABC transporter permease [Eubacterium multiforme]|uniref:N-acetylglucosamine transport system permease protein n=1 Tax=Eubacterium multiforme TaxID=83339 RepID=A0ABT9UTX2_9FIRM|nr:carbohydrate ABC transporter permease [Eubacterium multiforme]MDQ0149764.1 N-acetylglucosamine transport system permease protein [Eubacterium multiforme]